MTIMLNQPAFKKEVNDGLYSEHFYVATANGVTHDYLTTNAGIPSANIYTTIAEAHTAASVNDGINNVVHLSPDSHTQSSALTWSANMTHLVGMYPEAQMNQRSRIGHDANFDALLTVSGYGNLFKNLYFMHGRGSTTNQHAVEITGDRNSFINCHIGGPMHATEAGSATYGLLELTGAQECYFKNCVIGIETIARSAANSILRIGTGSSRNIFENCTFLSMSSADTPYFVEIASGVTYGWTLFKNCVFLNNSSSWATDLALGINFAPATTAHRVLMDSGCMFFNTTDVVAGAKEAGVKIGSVPAANTSVTGAVGIGLPLQPDHTA